MQKRCSRCETTKDVSEFNSNVAAYDGLSTYCRPCEAAYKRSVEYKNSASQRRAYSKSMMRHLRIKPSDY